MPATRELRHPDFGGLLLQADPKHSAALQAANFEIPKPGILAKRGGFRRVNHQHYPGAILLIDDLQRVCDYGKLAVFAGRSVWQHDQPTDPLFDPDYPPVAAASVNPAAGTPPLAVQFSSAGSWDPNGGALTYAWAFGDGGVSTEANPAHVYAGAGNYTATLTVTNSAGKTAAASVGVEAVAPSLFINNFDPDGATTPDEGANWVASAGMGGLPYHTLSYGGKILLVTLGATFDFYLSTDRGATFALTGSVAATIGGNALMEFASLESGRVFGAFNGKLQYSDDDGATWVDTGVTYTALSCGVATEEPGKVVFARVNTPNVVGATVEVFRSDNGGATFASVSTIPAIAGNWAYIRSLVCLGANTILMQAIYSFGGFAKWQRSADNGATWNVVPPVWQWIPNIVCNMPSFATDGTNVVVLAQLAGMPGNRPIYYSTDRGLTWIQNGDVGAPAVQGGAYQKVVYTSHGWFIVAGTNLYKAATHDAAFNVVAATPITARAIVGVP